MSEEQLKAFLEKVKSDPSLQEKLKAAGLSANQQAVLSVASEEGFAISADQTSNSSVISALDLTEEELEGASGGTNIRSQAVCPCILLWTDL